MRTRPTSTGMVAGHRVAFTPAHREDNDTPAVTTMVVGVRLSIEDITAVLMHLTNGCGRDDLIDWLADAGEVRRMVVEAAWGMGGLVIADERCALDKIEPGSWDAERLALIRACSVRVFTPAAPGREVPAPRVSPETAA